MLRALVSGWRWAWLCLLGAGCGSRSGLDGLQLPQLSPDRGALAPLPGPAAEGLFAEPPPQSTGCVDITKSYNSVPATVMLLIDQSGSMNIPFSGPRSRWDVLREAVVDPDNGLLAWLDQGARVGLMLYTSFDGFENGRGCPVITRVDAEFGNVDQVRSAYLGAEPADDGDTPTGESIDQAALFLDRVEGTAPRYILLLTDGAPDTCAQPDPQRGLPEAVDAAERAHAQGIRVYAVGVSEDLSGAALQRLANAGAGQPPNLIYGRDAQAEQPLFASTDPRTLADQLKGIIGDVRTCTIELATTVGTERTLDGRLLLDGAALENDPDDGWTFVDDDTLAIHGAACERILGEGERLEVRFPCVTELTPIR